MSLDAELPRRRSRSIWTILFIVLAIVLVGLLLVGALLLPPMRAAREMARRAACINRLKQISIALLNYHDVYRSFPPAYVADENGRPMHSWRVLILPYFADAEMNATYEQYDFNEPWDGPNNSQLAARMPLVFACPSGNASAGHTNYVAVVGDDTMWPGADAAALRKILDGPGNTIAVVETASGINWLQPRDLTLDEAVRGVNASSRGLSSNHPAGAAVSFADSSIHFLSDIAAPEDIRALITINAGDQAAEQVIDQ